MSRLQQDLIRTAQELGLRLSLDYAITFADGKTISFEAYLPDLGSPSGTLVSDSSLELDAATRNELRSRGLGLSTYGEPPPSELFDIEGYIEMFSEWGWSGEIERKPSWMS